MLGYVTRRHDRSRTTRYAAALLSVAGLATWGAGLATWGAGLPAWRDGLPGWPAVASASPVRGAQVRAVRTEPEVVVSAYAIAQLTSYIAGKYVRVVDLAPPGAQPQALPATASARAAIDHAALVIDVGYGYQPQVETAVKSTRRHLSLLPKLSKQAQPYEFWLDPYLMAKASVLIANELTAVDPAGRRAFQDGSRNFQSVAVSIESDFESTFSDCTRSEFVTADGAFGRLAASFDLQDVAVDATGVKKTAAIVQQNSLPTVFSEMGVPAGSVQQVARSTGAKVASLNPLELAPEPAGPAPLSYFAVMEYDLTALEGPLACDTTGNI